MIWTDSAHTVQLNSCSNASGLYLGGLRIKFRPLNRLSSGFRGFHQSHQAHNTILQLGHDRFLQHGLQIAVSQSSCHFKPSDLRIIKQNWIYLHSTNPLHQCLAAFHNTRNTFQISKFCMACKHVINSKSLILTKKIYFILSDKETKINFPLYVPCLIL